MAGPYEGWFPGGLVSGGALKKESKRHLIHSRDSARVIFSVEAFVEGFG